MWTISAIRHLGPMGKGYLLADGLRSGKRVRTMACCNRNAGDTVEDYSQHKESPTMPSRPIQIPSIAREMLESAGVPAMSLGVGNGYGRR